MDISPQAAVTCRGITKTFGQGEAMTRVLRGVDVVINLGEIFFISGPSGSGKTTLLSIITGLLDKEEGELNVLGSDFSKMTVDEKAEFRAQNIGFVFQSFNLLPALTVIENVALPLQIRGVSRQEALAKANVLLLKLGMAKRAHESPRFLSGGQQQRISVARALVHDPRLIICDEPTSALDQVAGLVVMNMLKEQAMSPNRAIIVVTHDKRTFKFATRIAHINDGRIESISTAQEELITP